MTHNHRQLQASVRRSVLVEAVAAFVNSSPECEQRRHDGTGKAVQPCGGLRRGARCVLLTSNAGTEVRLGNGTAGRGQEVGPRERRPASWTARSTAWLPTAGRAAERPSSRAYACPTARVVGSQCTLPAGPCFRRSWRTRGPVWKSQGLAHRGRAVSISHPPQGTGARHHVRRHHSGDGTFQP